MATQTHSLVFKFSEFNEEVSSLWGWQLWLENQLPLFSEFYLLLLLSLQLSINKWESWTHAIVVGSDCSRSKLLIWWLCIMLSWGIRNTNVIHNNFPIVIPSAQLTHYVPRATWDLSSYSKNFFVCLLGTPVSLSLLCTLPFKSAFCCWVFFPATTFQCFIQFSFLSNSWIHSIVLSAAKTYATHQLTANRNKHHVSWTLSSF